MNYLASLSDDLLVNVLARLPGKQVAQCKAVCQSWRSAIASPAFRKVYGSHHRGLIIYWFIPVPNNVLEPMQLNVSHSSFGEDHFSFLYRLGIDSLSMTQVVRGLICVDLGNAGLGTRLAVYNICTGQRLRIPNPQLKLGKHKRPTFHLGYDPETRRYKLLRLSSEKQSQAHVLTLRHSGSLSTWSWRELISPAAASGFNGIGGVNWEKEMIISPGDGFLCWLTWYERSRSLLLFDVNKEKFLNILLPSGFSSYAYYFGRAQFTEHQRLAVSLWRVSQGSSRGPECVCHVMEDDEGRKWSEHASEFPLELDERAVAVAADGSECEVVLINSRGAHVFCCSRDSTSRFRVGELPDGVAEVRRGEQHVWCRYLEGRVATSYYVFDGNYLHLPLDDILSGRF